MNAIREATLEHLRGVRRKVRRGDRQDAIGEAASFARMVRNDGAARMCFGTVADARIVRAADRAFKWAWARRA